jgi:hypothetical protein
MELVKVFKENSGGDYKIEEKINAWIKETNPIITRVVPSAAGSQSSKLFIYLVFYQERVESPK